MIRHVCVNQPRAYFAKPVVAASFACNPCPSCALPCPVVAACSCLIAVTASSVVRFQANCLFACQPLVA